jgi:hypothetical protein
MTMNPIQPAINTFPEELSDKIRQGMFEGIRREVQHRIDLGLPVHVSRDGRVINIGPEVAARKTVRLNAGGLYR